MKPALTRPEDRTLWLMTMATGLAVAVMVIAGVLQDNPGEVPIVAAFRSFAILAVIAVALPSAAFACGFRVFASALPLMLFFFFHFSDIRIVPRLLGLWGDAILPSAMALLIGVCAAAIILFRRTEPRRTAALVCVMAVSAAAASSAAVGGRMLQLARGAGPVVAELTAAKPLGAPSAPLPDVIYIVPDRYGAAEPIKAAFGVDNSGFYAELEKRGFYVAKNARANYAKTFQSLASSLNMTSLQPVFDAVGPKSVDREPLYAMIEDNSAQSTMRALGYSFVYLGNWWGPSRANRNADVDFYGARGGLSFLDEFERVLVGMTPLPDMIFGKNFTLMSECGRLKAQLDYLKSVRARSEKPVFVFAHLTMPHDPITMDENGACIRPVVYPSPDGDVSWETFQGRWRGYASHLNAELLNIFDSNAAPDGGRDLVFVVQADEGPYPRRLYEDGSMELFDFTDDEMRLKFGVINAVYWSRERYGEPYLTETPVNNWSIILSKITGTDLPLVTDERSVVFRSEKHPFETRDVTDIVAASRPLSASN